MLRPMFFSNFEDAQSKCPVGKSVFFFSPNAVEDEETGVIELGAGILRKNEDGSQFVQMIELTGSPEQDFGVFASLDHQEDFTFAVTPMSEHFAKQNALDVVFRNQNDEDTLGYTYDLIMAIGNLENTNNMDFSDMQERYFGKSVLFLSDQADSYLGSEGSETQPDAVSDLLKIEYQLIQKGFELAKKDAFAEFAVMEPQELYQKHVDLMYHWFANGRDEKDPQYQKLVSRINEMELSLKNNSDLRPA